ncbi:ribosomal RNA large subunit methyltransferase F-like [Hibiscus syriacus]|uniref:ribosomal RNA large subunit methyltransferase F-like n=1 Tax=Hibiscus syriacus TaxID=106335 RepID=UPI0019237DE3|nr:ribosomal RNA large subunit methyltransferase F-like [Hibiscus syriacus]
MITERRDYILELVLIISAGVKGKGSTGPTSSHPANSPRPPPHDHGPPLVDPRWAALPYGAQSIQLHPLDRDLLSSDIIPRANSKGDVVRGFDIGTGANCIYPLLGASLLGWNFVASVLRMEKVCRLLLLIYHQAKIIV